MRVWKFSKILILLSLPFLIGKFIVIPDFLGNSTTQYSHHLLFPEAKCIVYNNLLAAIDVNMKNVVKTLTSPKYLIKFELILLIKPYNSNQNVNKPKQIKKQVAVIVVYMSIAIWFLFRLCILTISHNTSIFKYFVINTHIISNSGFQ